MAPPSILSLFTIQVCIIDELQQFLCFLVIDTIDWLIDISNITFQDGGQEQQIVIMAGYLNYLRSQFSIHRNHVDQRCIILYCISSRKLYKGTNEIISFYPTNLNTLYLLLLFYSVIEIMTVRSRPAICTLIGWVKSFCLFSSQSGFCGLSEQLLIF